MAQSLVLAGPESSRMLPAACIIAPGLSRLIHGLCAARALSCKANQANATAEDG